MHFCTVLSYYGHQNLRLYIQGYIYKKSSYLDLNSYINLNNNFTRSQNKPPLYLSQLFNFEVPNFNTIKMSDPQWQSDIDAAFKTAPLALQDNRTDAQKNQTQVFLLKNLDYYNLQKYLHVGTGLPQDDSHFKGLFPPNNLQKLTAIDASIYNQLSQWFSTVAGNCLKFDSNTMPKFVTITGAIVNYCDDMNRYMSGPGLLQDQIKILKTDGNTPDTDSWKTACGKIKVILKILSGRAGNRIADIKALIAELKAFQDLTIADQKNIGYLERQFITGPVQKNFTDPTPATDKRTYTTRLNAALGDLSAEVNKLQKDIHNEEDERQDDIVKAATAVTYVWIVPV